MTSPITVEMLEGRHQAKVSHLLGICPKCGDAGWWIDGPFHYCDCPAGVAEQAKAAAEDAEAQAEREREQEAKDRRRDEDEAAYRGPRFGASYGANSAGRS